MFLRNPVWYYKTKTISHVTHFMQIKCSLLLNVALSRLNKSDWSACILGVYPITFKVLPSLPNCFVRTFLDGFMRYIQDILEMFHPDYPEVHELLLMYVLILALWPNCGITPSHDTHGLKKTFSITLYCVGLGSKKVALQTFHSWRSVLTVKRALRQNNSHRTTSRAFSSISAASD